MPKIAMRPSHISAQRVSRYVGRDVMYCTRPAKMAAVSHSRVLCRNISTVLLQLIYCTVTLDTGFSLNSLCFYNSPRP